MLKLRSPFGRPAFASAFVVGAAHPKRPRGGGKSETKQARLYAPRACSDSPLALSVRLVALRRVRFSLIVEPRQVRAWN